MIKITVTDTPLDERRGMSVKTGKPYHMRTQTAWAHVIGDDGKPGDFPEKFEIPLEDDQAQYPRGTYQLQPSVIKVKADSFGHPQLVLSRPRLVAFPVAQASAAAKA